LETNYVGSSPTIGTFLYVAQAVERVVAIIFGPHTTHKGQTSMPSVGLEPSLSKRGAVDRPATGTGEVSHLLIENEN